MALSVGNKSAASGPLVSGVDRGVSAGTLGALDRLGEGNVDTPDVAFDAHGVRLERFLRRTT
jgi:hypothetical protein